MKRCTACGIEKQLLEFEEHYQGRDGRRSQCRTCVSSRRSKYFKDVYYADPVNRQKKRVSDQAYEKSTPRAALRRALNLARKRDAELRPAANTMTTEDVMALWERQGGRCALSGIPMRWGRENSKLGPSPTSVSLDRIDQSRGYEAGNVRLVCFRINIFRGDMNDDEMFEMLEKFYQNVKFGVRAVA